MELYFKTPQLLSMDREAIIYWLKVSTTTGGLLLNIMREAVEKT